MPSSLLAGGAVVTRRPRGRELEVLLVHRPRYADWSLPKGKVERLEPVPATAVREVAEETGVTVALRAPLAPVTYPVKAGNKQVHYWSATALTEVPRPADDEVDEVRWTPVPDARRRLSHDHDRLVLSQHLAQPPTTALVVLRHAKAMDRKDWSRVDAERPLAARGRTEAERVVALLSAYGVARVVTSAADRCVSTVRPFATERSLPLDPRPELTEEHGSHDPDGVAAVLDRLRAETTGSGTPTVVCGHRPVLPHMFAALGLPSLSLRPAEAVVVHLTADGAVHAVERHRVPR